MTNLDLNVTMQFSEDFDKIHLLFVLPFAARNVPFSEIAAYSVLGAFDPPWGSLGHQTPFEFVRAIVKGRKAP